MLNRRGLIATSTLILILCAGVASAQLYKWKADDGRVFYSDKPAPGQKSEVMDYDDVGQQAKLDQPVTGKKVVMYSATWCGVCKKAKAYFEANGVSYTDYDIENTSKGRTGYKRLKGKGVPIILVDQKRLDGFSRGKFEKAYEG